MRARLVVCCARRTGGSSPNDRRITHNHHPTPPPSAPQLRGAALAAAFTARSKFVLLEKSRQLVMRGLGAHDAGKRVRPPYSNADYVFQAMTPGRVLVRAEDRICLFELQSRRVVAEITGVVVKYVSWSPDGSHVALLGKHAVVLADKDLTQVRACGVRACVLVGNRAVMLADRGVTQGCLRPSFSFVVGAVRAQ